MCHPMHNYCCTEMAEWFFRKKRNEVERVLGWGEYFTSNRSTEMPLGFLGMFFGNIRDLTGMMEGMNRK